MDLSIAEGTEYGELEENVVYALKVGIVVFSLRTLKLVLDRFVIANIQQEEFWSGLT